MKRSTGRTGIGNCCIPFDRFEPLSSIPTLGSRAMATAVRILASSSELTRIDARRRRERTGNVFATANRDQPLAKPAVPTRSRKRNCCIFPQNFPPSPFVLHSQVPWKMHREGARIVSGNLFKGALLRRFPGLLCHARNDRSDTQNPNKSYTGVLL